MRKLLLACVAAVGLLGAILVVRAVGFTSRQIPAAPAAELKIDRDASLRRLSEAVRFRTIAAPEMSPAQIAEFARMGEFLGQAFPRVAKQLEKETVGGHSLLFTWPGRNRALKPMLLMAHMDVVPAVENDWRHPPFSGAIADGFVWGRGTMDDKASMIAMLDAVEHLLGAGFTPDRTVYLAFGHDEEIGGHNGAAKIAQLLHGRGIALEFVLDEGLNIVEKIIPDVAAPVALIGIAEKGYLSLRLTVETSGGHSSVPPADTAIGVLSRALHRLEDTPFPSRLSGATRRMLEYLGPEMSWTNRMALANLWLFDPLVRRQLARSPLTGATIRTTLAPTMFSAGSSENVLPARAAATVNLRLLPGDTIENATEQVRRVIGDPRVKIARLPVHEEPSPVSDIHGPSFQLIARTIRQTEPAAVVAPALLVAATDSRHYRRLTPNIYRFLPIAVGPEDAARYHGVDERIAIADYERCVRFYAQLIRNASDR